MPTTAGDALIGAARAAPYEKGTETGKDETAFHVRVHAARAAPYEKGTETFIELSSRQIGKPPRARPPMRRGLKR